MPWRLLQCGRGASGTGPCQVAVADARCGSQSFAAHLFFFEFSRQNCASDSRFLTDHMILTT